VTRIDTSVVFVTHLISKRIGMNVCVDLCMLNGRHPEPTSEPYSEPSPDIAASMDLCDVLLLSIMVRFFAKSPTIFEESL